MMDLPLLPEDTRRFYIVSCHVLWRELCYFAALSSVTHEVHFLPQGLHNTPDLLRSELQKAIDGTPDRCEAVIIGYGLCSNGIEGIVARDKPLAVVRGHDCITLLLGSKERYRAYFDAHPGTYWYSPGWIDTSTQPGKERYERALAYYVELYGEENAEYLMQMEQAWMQNYSNAAYVDLGFGDRERYQEFTRECADFLGWNADFLEGDPRLVRDLLDGNWEDEKILVVPPGHRIVASHDEDTIIEAVPAAEAAEASACRSAD